MEIVKKDALRLDAEMREVARGLSGAECHAIAADLAERGLAGSPTYAAWLRTELLKAAQRKWVATAGAAAAG